MLQQSKDEEALDRIPEVASAIAEEGLQAGEESVPDRLSRERRNQLQNGRHVAVGPWRLGLGRTAATKLSATDHLREMPALRGSVVAVAIDAKHRFSKTPRLSVILTAGHGAEGDAHYGQFVQHRYLARRAPRAANLRQVHLIPSELFEALRKSGFKVSPGVLGENITTAGLDLETLPLNTQLRIGTSANIRLTGLRTPCVLIDRFKSGLKGRLLDAPPNPPFRVGVMAVVSEGGEISRGDPIRAILPDCPHLPLPPL
jgi:MOSC domain-containing protein YiiM